VTYNAFIGDTLLVAWLSSSTFWPSAAFVGLLYRLSHDLEKNMSQIFLAKSNNPIRSYSGVIAILLLFEAKKSNLPSGCLSARLSVRHTHERYLCLQGGWNRVNRGIVLWYGAKHISVSWTISACLMSVTDGQTDGRTFWWQMPRFDHYVARPREKVGEISESLYVLHLGPNHWYRLLLTVHRSAVWEIRHTSDGTNIHRSLVTA